MLHSLREGQSDGAMLLRLLYSFFHLSGNMNERSLLQLQYSGLIWRNREGQVCPAYERRFLFDQVCETAETHHALFSRYDLGGAEELGFSDCCRSGAIRIVCRGIGRTINGKKELQKSYEIQCKEQSIIGNPVEIDLSTRTCVLIKLARSHPAIDFIIYQSEGPVATRTLYFVQVSSSPYQARPKERKLSAVNNVYDTVSNVSVYNYYHSMFAIRGASVFYVYSSPVNIPSFTTVQNCVYFHKL